jgi:hypothetical protein
LCGRLFSVSLTPNLAAQSIEKLRLETAEKFDHVILIDTAFGKLNVKYSSLEEGATEMAIEIPMDEETKTLEDLVKEAKDWHRICEAISETFDPDRNRVTIRTIASGSLLIFLAAVPTFIYGAAKCLKGVNTVLTELIKMKSLYKQLVSSNTPKEILEPLALHNSGKAKTDLDQLAITLVDEHFKGKDDGRRNELKNSLSMALLRLSNKLADGTKVTLRLAAPKEPAIEEGQQPSREQKEQFTKISQFKKIQIEVNASKAALDYKAHADELMSALPAPSTENIEKSDVENNSIEANDSQPTSSKRARKPPRSKKPKIM